MMPVGMACSLALDGVPVAWGKMILTVGISLLLVVWGSLDAPSDFYS